MIKVILKTERFNGEVTPIIFLPDAPANPGRISYFTPSGGHGEAGIDYYYKCKPLKDDIKANTLLNLYANYGEYSPVKRVYKQTANDRAEAYRRL